MKSSGIWLAFALLMAGIAADAVAQGQQMYQWTDKDGTVHFSDTPPPDQQVEASAVPQGAEKMGQETAAAAATDMPSAAQQKREELARKRDEAEAQAALRDAGCAAKRAEVARLEPNRRVFYTDENGETVRMDDEVRVAQVEAAKRYLEENCD